MSGQPCQESLAGQASPAPSAWRSEKIRPEHLDRVAVVYVRQSSMQQVLHHKESTRLQYGLRTRAVDLGWAADRVLVIDDDLGKSGASAEGRVGFQRLVSEVTLGNVGIIFGVEMSRLARSCKDWHHLLEACGLFRCLLADLDGVYDPAGYNDRLLLGLKGTMSEAELHMLKQRMEEGRLAKARRGELAIPLPIGYSRRASGEVVLDPDEEVQAAVRTVFRTFEARRTLNATLAYLVEHRIRLGVRARSGDGKGEIEWVGPNRMTLQNMLKNPAYAGAYAYGRRRTDPRLKRGGRPNTGRVTTPTAGWHALIRDHHPAYISWDRHEAILAQLHANSNVASQGGAPRQGAALLSGLLVCAKCGWRMSARYSTGTTRHDYVCQSRVSNYAGAPCQSMAGAALDRFVEQRALEALAPASLDLAFAATRNVEEERRRLEDLWRKKLERAGYEADRAARQFQRVEPENRLVARSLEADWEARLADKQILEEEHRRFERDHPRALTELEQEAIRRLSTDIPALWSAPTTHQVERKEILRLIIEKIAVNARGSTEKVDLEIHWATGTITRHTMVRPVARLEQLSYYDDLKTRVAALKARGANTQEIADELNAAGLRPPKRCATYGRSAIQGIVTRLGLGTLRPRHKGVSALAPHETWLPELAASLGMPDATLYTWVRRGWIKARQDAQDGRWIAWADAAERARLAQMRARPPGYHSRRRWLTESQHNDSASPNSPSQLS